MKRVGLKPRSMRLKKVFKRFRKKKNPYTVKALDTVFSTFIRRSGANEEGIVHCYTCPYAAHYKKMHAGHYISRFFKATRWDENNVKPQCFMCNIYRKGNAVIFRRNLVKEIGEEKVSVMELKANYLIRGFTNVDALKERIEHYKSLTLDK